MCTGVPQSKVGSAGCAPWGAFLVLHLSLGKRRLWYPTLPRLLVTPAPPPQAHTGPLITLFAVPKPPQPQGAALERQFPGVLIKYIWIHTMKNLK